MRNSPPTVSTQHEAGFGFRVWHQRNTRMMPRAHTHPDIEINYLTRGELAYLHGGTAIPVERHSFTAFWGGMPHQTLSHRFSGEGIWITLPLGWVLQWRLPCALTDRFLSGEIIASPPDPAERLRLERWLDDVQSEDDARQRAMMLEIEARFHRLALATPPAARMRTRGAGSADGRAPMARAMAYLSSHYREELTVAVIARHVGLHPKSLMRAFKRQSGTPLWDYLTRLRVSHAQRLLVTTDMKVLDVALESGFSSMASFYSAFSPHSQNLRPMDYRRRHQNASFPV